MGPYTPGVSRFRQVWVVVPTYNERANIAPLVEEIRRAVPGSLEILFVDDASPDGTADAARAIANVKVLARTGPRGYGFSLRDGIELAMRSGADAVITMDADLSHDPSIIPDLLARLEDADVVIGSRYCGAQATVKDWSWTRLLLSRTASALVRLSTGVAVSDPTNGYRCWRVSLLRRMELGNIRSGGFAFLYESLSHAKRAGGTFLEVPNLFRGRIHGESKLNLNIVLEALRLLPRMLVGRLFRSA